MPSLTYLIATAPRTGSTMLAEALQSTGHAGQPAEYFDIHAPNERYWVEKLGIKSNEEYFEKVLAAATTQNGVAGFKVHWHQLETLKSKLTAMSAAKGAPPETAALHQLLRSHLGEVRYIWLRRQNKISQAISYYKANKTGIWRVRTSGADIRNTPDISPEFDFDAIDRYVALLLQFDLQWMEYFKRNRIKVLVVAYEQFIAEYVETIGLVLQFLGLPYDGMTFDRPDLIRQSDENSLEWEKRYLERQQNLLRGRIQVQMPSQQMSAGALPQPESVTCEPTGSSEVRTAVETSLKPTRLRRQRTKPIEVNNPVPRRSLIAYGIHPEQRTPFTRASSSRIWMDETPDRFAYRCLPMVIANQAGWLILNPEAVAVTWDGGEDRKGLAVECPDGAQFTHAHSHFGSGILTFTINYLIRVPRGYNLLVRGPANTPKDGIYALEGIVEADWSVATFTMNWKVTRAGHRIVFERDEPIAMISPMRRGELEQFSPELRSLSDDPALRNAYEQWSRSRTGHLEELAVTGSPAQQLKWQRHYYHGLNVDGTIAPEHQTKMKLREFTDKRK